MSEDSIRCINAGSRFFQFGTLLRSITASAPARISLEKLGSLLGSTMS